MSLGIAVEMLLSIGAVLVAILALLHSNIALDEHAFLARRVDRLEDERRQ